MKDQSAEPQAINETLDILTLDVQGFVDGLELRGCPGFR